MDNKKSSDNIHGFYDVSLAEEIDRIIENLKRIGISSPTKKEATKLIAIRSKKVNVSDKEAIDYIKQWRGIL